MSTLSFNDTSLKLGIIQACEDNCGLGDAAISGNTNLLKRFTRHTNKAMSKIWAWIFFSYGGIQYDDSNQNNLPYGTDTLTADKRVYANPAGAQALKGVAYKDASGNYIPLTPITFEMLQEHGYTPDNFMSTSGEPQYYMPLGESYYIFPASSVTRSAGIKAYIDRGISAFAYDATTKTPGFASEFHDAVPVGASIEWHKVYKPDGNTLQELKADWLDYEMSIKKFYTQRYEQLFPPVIRTPDALTDFD